MKPDLVAPGNRLVATIPEVAMLRTDLPERVRLCNTRRCNHDYLELSGTSMAAASYLWADAVQDTFPLYATFAQTVLNDDQ